MTMLDILKLVWLGSMAALVLAIVFSVGWLVGYLRCREEVRRQFLNHVARHERQAEERFKP